MTFQLFARVGVALLLALATAAKAEDGGRPSAPERNPLGTQVRKAEQPTLSDEAATVQWSEREVSAAKAACAKILAGLALDYELLGPIREGRCGTPAPILLKAIGSDPRVEIDPPATVTCAMARALSDWLDGTVQPEAHARIGAPVVKLTNASSYACRNRYNGAETPLSEHALANALDVSEFAFQSGEKLTVLASWPRVAIEPPPLPPPNPIPASSEITGSLTAVHARDKAVDGVETTKTTTIVAKSNPFVPAPADVKTNPFVLPTTVSKDAPPKPPAEATSPDGPSVSEFVRKVHQDACGTFGTVLGPEANEAHKDHFHLDMKARQHKAICE